MASEAASDPAPGSVRQYEARHSIVASRGSQADRRASHANSSIIQAHMLWRGEGGGILGNDCWCEKRDWKISDLIDDKIIAFLVLKTCS